MRNKIIDLIIETAKEPSGFELLEKKVAKFSKKDLSENIIDCGVLPEVFDHDSSEEKMWAKYSDFVLASFFSAMGLDSEVLGARGNSADVLAKADGYTIVSDAKTFRLSRSAKNQKDFKISALDSWRQDNNYSLLAGPLFQYPTRNSQIYQQAIQKNVTLISYIHLKFLLDLDKKIDLEPLWKIGNTLESELSKVDYLKAQPYWKKVDKVVCQISGKDIVDLTHYKKEQIKRLQELGKEGIEYWERKVKEYEGLPKDEAIKLLIKAHKIDKKIQQIKKAIEVTLD
jgi:type II restriction enzyme|tara:strand:+ start:1473 stop:2327 length:855 start_codon:yes stop_codon:yes gene_type:complete